MKTTRFTESQIVQALKEYEGGKKADAICGKLCITLSTFYNWKKRSAGMDGLQLKRLNELEDDNRKVKNIYAELALDNKMLKMFFQKSGKVW